MPGVRNDMMIKFRRALSVAVGSLCAALFVLAPTPARADTKLLIIPADQFVIAPGGVDLRTGRYTYSQTDLNIGGQDENGGLSLTRTMSEYVGNHANPFGNFSHNWDIMLVETKVDLFLGKPVGVDYRMNVNFGGRSMTFEARNVAIGYAYTSSRPVAYLTFDGGGKESATVVYTFTAQDGTVMKFRPMGNLDCANQDWYGNARRCSFVSEMIQPDGTKYTFDYSYNVGLPGNRARLTKVTSSRGYALLLEGSGSLVSKACVINLARTTAPAGGGSCPANATATASYTYASGTSRPSLASVTGPTGATSSFTYAEPNSQIIMGFIKPGQSAPWLTNTISLLEDEQFAKQEIVNSQSFADGRSFTYIYQFAPFTTYMRAMTIAGGSYTDAQGGIGAAFFGFPIRPGTEPGYCSRPPCPPVQPGDADNSTYQQTLGPTGITDPLGQKFEGNYCDPVAMAGLPAYRQERCFVLPLQWFKDGEGIRTDLKYDNNGFTTEARRKAKPGSGLPDIVTAATYACASLKTCGKPTSMTDGRGNVTDYTYDPAHGGVLTETGPAVDGVRPQKRSAYIQRYAWISNGAGGFVQAATAVWLLASEKTCRTTATVGDACAGGAADEVATTYDYGPDSGPNTLLLRGRVMTADGISLRTCFGYDEMGRKISETSPRAGLAVCP